MNIIGIETSCDETAAAIVKDGKTIISNTIASSAEIHEGTGGIVPENAARQQVKYIIPVIQKSLGDTSRDDIDAIAVTYGPGLIGSLLVGVETAKTLSFLWKKPIIPTNHLAAHIYANWLEGNTPQFPALALVVSGGHTDIVILNNHNHLKWIGGTRDDAAGEAFDKTARLLGLPYPGGPSISQKASNYKGSFDDLSLFPRPMINSGDFDFSFSGLKTSVLNYLSKNIAKNISLLSAEVQEAIVDVLVYKTLKAIEKYQPKSLLLAGGVAANLRLREKFKSEIKLNKINVDFHVPSPALCTDNAAYIASYAYYNNSPMPWSDIKANPELTITGQA